MNNFEPPWIEGEDNKISFKNQTVKNLRQSKSMDSLYLFYK